jgi:hypothetical protein
MSNDTSFGVSAPNTRRIEFGQTDPHDLIYRSRCALRGLNGLAGEKEEVIFKGYDLGCLLALIETNLSLALEQMGGDPDKH